MGVMIGRKVLKSELRYTRNVGLGFKAPRHVSLMDSARAAVDSCVRTIGPNLKFQPSFFPLQKAFEADFVDKKCPFTGNVGVRGRILTGVIATNKMKRYTAQYA